MRIVCPQCQFVRDVPDDKIPPTAQTATCPKCKLRFNFRTGQALTPAGGGEPTAPARPRDTDKDQGEVEIGGVRRPIGKPWTIEPGKVPPEVADLHVPPPEESGQPGSGKAPEEPAGDIWQRLESLGASEERRTRRTPPEGFRPDGRQETEVPWELADTLGFPKAAWLTLKAVLTAPRRFFAEMPVNRPIGRALTYALCFFVFNGIANVMSIHFAASDPEVQSFLATNPDFQSVLQQLLTPGGTILLFGLTYLFSAASFLLSSAVTHLFLKLFGDGRSGLGQTMRVNAYAQTPTIFYLIPSVGHYIGSFWYLALLVIGLKSIHKTSGPRVVLALIAPLLIALGLILTMTLWGSVKA